jgi:hypothetical protein
MLHDVLVENQVCQRKGSGFISFLPDLKLPMKRNVRFLIERAVDPRHVLNI